jgi:hypothetical protein
LAGVVQCEVRVGENQRALYATCVFLVHSAPVVEELVNQPDIASFEEFAAQSSVRMSGLEGQKLVNEIAVVTKKKQ